MANGRIGQRRLCVNLAPNIYFNIDDSTFFSFVLAGSHAEP